MPQKPPPLPGQTPPPLPKTYSPVPYSESDIPIITASAQRLVDVINDSIRIAEKSKNIQTKLSRLNLAKEKLGALKIMIQQYPFMSLNQLGEVENQIRELELKIQGNAK